MSSTYDTPPPAAPPATQPGSPEHAKNPSYPRRVHVKERAELDSLLQHWDDRIAQAKKKLDVLGHNPDRPAYERMYVQMLGARDQLAEAVRRLPMEVGGLYDEDKHRLDEAVHALERIFRRWT